MREVSLEQYQASAKQTMAYMDHLCPEMRQLVHEYGVVIVEAMINDGFPNSKRGAVDLLPALKSWRDRRQAEIAAAPVYITQAMVDRMKQSLRRRVPPRRKTML